MDNVLVAQPYEVSRKSLFSTNDVSRECGITYLGKAELLNHYQGKGLVIVGCSYNVWDDLHHFRSIVPQNYRYDVMVLNDMGLYFPNRFTHWASLHAERFAFWRKYCNKTCNTHSKEEAPGVDYSWEVLDRYGSGGMFGLKIAYLMGYEKIVLAGIPLNNDKRFFDANTKRCDFAAKHVRGHWDRQRDIFQDRVRSMSGYTQELFGKVETSWSEIHS